MSELRRLVLAALCAGAVAGLVAAVAHQIGTVPLIVAAERSEPATAGAPTASPTPGAPETAIARAGYTLAADLLAGIGFALLLAAGLALRGSDGGWREGLFWGLAGFLAVAVAPGLGLPPELPGAAAAPLAARQLWWLATAIATAGGLALLAFTRRPAWAVLAAALILLPQLYGAPQPPEAAPDAPAQRFAARAMVASFLFWAVLGAATGHFYRRFARPGRLARE